MSKIELLPLFCWGVALFVSLVPNFDARTRNQFGFVFQLVWIALLLWLSSKGLLTTLQLAFLLTQSLVWIGISLKPVFWFLSGLSAAAILSTNLSVFLIFAYLHMAFLLLVILQTGGLYKGSASYQSILFFLVIDLSSFFSLSLPYSWSYWIWILPGLARILFLLAAPYARSLFVNCPTEIMLLALGSCVPIGTAWLYRIPATCPDFKLLELLCFSSSFISITLFLIEKSRRQKAIYLFMSQSALAVNLILNPTSEKYAFFACLLTLSALLNSAIWIYFLDFTKMRFLNIALGALTLFLLVYKP